MFEIYNCNPNLKAAGVQIAFTQEQIQEYARCAKDPLYFINNYAKIISLDEGIVPFKTYPYQDRFVDAIHHNNYVIGKLGRQLGKSAIVAGYTAWYLSFNEHKRAAILGNKQSLAIEIFGRVQFIIENLPPWLQQGIVEWNKRSLKLENGSTCFAASSSASAVRGESINCVTGDTKIKIRNKKTGEIKYISLDEFAFLINNNEKEKNDEFNTEQDTVTVKFF